MRLELTGRVFGRLTVIRFMRVSSDGSCWLCRCTCGREREFSAHRLRAKREPTRSCGCLKNRPKHVDLRGRRFGRLVVQQRAGLSGVRAALWQCACDCGRTHTVEARSLKCGAILSCGCLKALTMSRQFRKHGLSGTREGAAVLGQKRRARLRSVGGVFTHAEILALRVTQKDRCVYCAVLLPENFHRDHIVPLVRGGHNGIANIQLLCPRCNRSKGKKTHEEFLTWRAA